MGYIVIFMKQVVIVKDTPKYNNIKYTIGYVQKKNKFVPKAFFHKHSPRFLLLYHKPFKTAMHHILLYFWAVFLGHFLDHFRGMICPEKVIRGKIIFKGQKCNS